ncbi:HicB_like antitoxin of bacterial toxin-antitoxin system [uncultured archaeon]|nr:HicB_like antitoxin of bacterial toxin-antitoxin system [uncultured archaeon]
MYRFLVVIEKANKNFSAYSPDLPGCVATGATREEAEKNMYEAIEMHMQGLVEDNLPIPESKSFAEYVAIAEKSSTAQAA